MDTALGLTEQEHAGRALQNKFNTHFHLENEYYYPKRGSDLDGLTALEDMASYKYFSKN